jgi:uncharacterized surface protein with fasciclin (FAS1) repeats
MRLPTLALASLALGFVGLAPAGASPAAKAAPPDLVAAAMADERLSTLVTALVRADLVATLQGPGPYTVFAPTDAAFEALPPGALAGLLDDVQALRRVLLHHVVAGRITSDALLPLRAARTVDGADLVIGLTVGEARVLQADGICSNGVIHVIDRVLLPEAPVQEPALDLQGLLLEAIEVGVPLFNSGDVAGCAAAYERAARRAVHAAAPSVGALHRRLLGQALEAPASSPEDRAWALRRVFDRILADVRFTPQREAALPAGFPEPGPVGHVIEKTYPRYRAARAPGDGAFWTLFRHIKANDVEMTAPVEMTMDGDLRMADMAFLYETPTQGAAGRQGDVDVLDLDRQTVLSIALRGRRSAELLALAQDLLESERAAQGRPAAGPLRVLGYNSPMVPAERQLFEVQLPVGRQP